MILLSVSFLTSFLQLKFNPKILVPQRGPLAHHEVMQLAFLDGEERAILVVQRADVPVAQHHVKS